MLDSGEEVTAQVVLDDRHLSGRGRTTLLHLSWNHHDPLAVHLFITATPDHPSLPRGHWVLLRDLLRTGLYTVAGDGAVHLEPEPARRRVGFRLQREAGVCEVSVPRQPLQAFLDATDAVVPAGGEQTQESLDAVLTELLAGS